MLVKTIDIMEKVFKGRPTVQYYIQKYRGDEIWQKNDMANLIIYNIPTHLDR